jgi:hypothetical protein
VEILSGTSTITAFIANSRLRTFVNPLIKDLAGPKGDLVKFNFSEDKFQDEYSTIMRWIDEWFYTIRQYSRTEIDGITKENRVIIWKLSEMVNFCNE